MKLSATLGPVECMSIFPPHENASEVEKHEQQQQRSIEAFANCFVGFIRPQTEDSSRYALARSDTPKKGSAGSASEGELSGLLRKSSIIDGSDYPSPGAPDTSTPLARGQPRTESDTAGSPDGHSIARKLFDHGGPSVGVGSLPIADVDEVPSAAATGTTPKRAPDQGTPVNGHSSAIGSNNQSLPHYRSIGDASYSTPPRTGRARNMLLSITSTPIQGSGGRGRSTTQQSPCAANGSQRYEAFRSAEATAGSDGEAGWRSKTGSPCLGDFIVTHSMKSQKTSRRSPLASSNHSYEPSSVNSTPPQNSTQNSSIFVGNDFPQLSAASAAPASKKDATEGSDGRQQKKRISLPIRPEQPETPAGAAGSGKKVQRRRIAPTTVSRTASGRPDFTSSSFKTENNLAAIEGVEEEAAQDPRGMLRRLKDQIRTDFAAEQVQMKPVARAKQSLQSSFAQTRDPGSTVEPTTDGAELSGVGGDTEVARGELVIEFEKVTQKDSIDRLVAIYGLLMDLNLVPNVLNELAYLINLVSMKRLVPVDTASGGVSTAKAPTVDDLSCVLRSPHNCVYFATEVLYRERLLLALLDSTSLRVVVENEQLSALQPTLNGFLREVLAQKTKLESASVHQPSNASDLQANSSITNVFYQQENDTKDHFPSVKEFGAFNKQRDYFYTILRIWESEHLNPAWVFEAKLGPKVHSMLDISQHPINMAHLAKLFSAQLIISFNFDNSASELQMALPSIDLTKLSKLRQRLVAPSIFSTQYLFPGSQTFFRDFVVASENHPIFIEQLKAVLIHELLQMNGSSYDIFSISDAKNKNRTEYAVRPETIATMRVLAKFIGFIIARPFQYEGCRSTIVENRQIELRNTLLPLFDVKPVLMRSVADRKLVITVPWLVQYLSMLDAVTLRLRYYEELFHMLRDIYQATAMCGLSANRHLFVIPTSKFIVRSCLDWLFDQSNVPEEYFNSSHQAGGSTAAPVHIEQLAMERFGRLEQSSEPSSTGATIEKPSNAAGEGATIELPIAFNPLLEGVLSAACPFLADFRVSVMPSKVEKTVSRTGRFRHITTRFSGAVTQPQASTVNEPATAIETEANTSSKDLSQASGHNHSKVAHGNNQHRLVEAFLQSQTLSLRRTVEFIMERATSAVIKDFQMAFLLPEKKAVTDRIAAVQGAKVQDVRQQIYTTCTEALSRINNTWESHVPKMLNKRITESLDALLPAETIDVVRITCKNIALERCVLKSNEWRQSYMSDTELFCRNVQSESDNIFKAQQNRQPDKPSPATVNQTVFSISANCESKPSVLFGKIQLLIHYAAFDPQQLTARELFQFLAQAHALLEEPGLTMTPTMNRMLGYMLLQLFLLLIKARCDLSVPELVQCAIKVWKHAKMANHCTPPLADPEEFPACPVLPSHERSFGYPAQIEQFRRKRKQQDVNYIFSHLVSNRIIRMLEENLAPGINYYLYATFITALLDAGLITMSLLNEQFVAIFNEEWSKPILDRISDVIKQVLGRSGLSNRSGNSIDDSNSEMFMEMLSDLARDMTNF